MKATLSSLGGQFERLSSREQIIALLMIMVLGGMVLGLGTFFVKRDLGRRDMRIAAKFEKLEKLAGLKGDYQRRLSEQNRLAAEIRRNNKTRLLSYIEDVSKKASIQLKNAAERQGEATGSDLLKEVAAEVKVENVSIDRLYDFLNRLERGNRLVKVRKLEIETRFDNAKMLNAKVTVGTFKTTEGS